MASISRSAAMSSFRSGLSNRPSSKPALWLPRPAFRAAGASRLTALLVSITAALSRFSSALSMFASSVYDFHILGSRKVRNSFQLRRIENSGTNFNRKLKPILAGRHKPRRAVNTELTRESDERQENLRPNILCAECSICTSTMRDF